MGKVKVDTRVNKEDKLSADGRAPPIYMGRGIGWEPPNKQKKKKGDRAKEGRTRKENKEKSNNENF